MFLFLALKCVGLVLVLLGPGCCGLGYNTSPMALFCVLFYCYVPPRKSDGLKPHLTMKYQKKLTKHALKSELFGHSSLIPRKQFYKNTLVKLL